MAKVSLRIYNRDIENLIDQGHLDEAIAHARHILRSFPKHLETYRLLGKAYLEAKRYDEAVDILQRVLMAVPDDFVSHVGMSIIRDDQGKLDDAIWHMERAFESQPSNAAIQGELRRLYGRRDGVEPPKIRMTRGALAHMYVQGELFPQAISEIKAVLGQDSQRVDMKVLLALAFFRSGQKTDAAEICRQLLSRSGGEFCLDANRILVELLPGSDAAEDAEISRARVNELDPYAAFSQGSVFQSGAVSDSAITLERLEFSGQSVELGSDWNSSGIGLTPAGGQPDWLKTSASSADRGAGSASSGEEEIPGFLRQAGWAESSGEAEQAASPFQIENTPPISETDLAPGEMPDWLKSMSPSEPSGASMPASASASAQASDMPDWLSGSSGGFSASSSEAPITPEDTPTWLRSFRDTPAEITPEEYAPAEPAPELYEPSEPTAAEYAPIETAPAADDLTLPDWLTPSPEATASVPAEPEAAAATLETLGTSAQEQDDAVAWLEGLATKHGAKPEELVTDPNARTETPPEWVEQARAIAESQPPEVVKPASEAAEPAAEDDQTGMWLRDLVEKETIAESAVEPAADEAPPTSMADDTPTWLRNFGADDAETLPPLASTEPAPAPGADLPSWLEGLDREDAAEESLPKANDELPAWLTGEDQEVAAPASPPTKPADWQPMSIETEPEAEPATAPLARKSAAASKAPAAHARQAEAEAEAIDPTLEAAQSDLGRGDIPSALDHYIKLIKRGRYVEDIIRDLRDALYRYPVEVTIWQALGDAYMRANRLQEALDAYTKAEELLR
ncbi:MAG TPA: tetratricopeptide repeat protein [Anaerolineales bacterium]